MCGVSDAYFFASVSVQASSTVSNEAIGCTQEGPCDICSFNNCPNDAWNVQDTLEVRCVEYDHIEPAHCANFEAELWQYIEWNPFPYYTIKNCHKLDCYAGTPLPIECNDPWISPF